MDTPSEMKLSCQNAPEPLRIPRINISAIRGQRRDLRIGQPLAIGIPAAVESFHTAVVFPDIDKIRSNIENASCSTGKI